MGITESKLAVGEVVSSPLNLSGKDWEWEKNLKAENQLVARGTEQVKETKPHPCLQELLHAWILDNSHAVALVKSFPSFQ